MLDYSATNRYQLICRVQPTLDNHLKLNTFQTYQAKAQRIQSGCRQIQRTQVRVTLLNSGKF